ncbi:hypothetical protein LTR97_012268 [Elasticomyces elasticus]|uniref:Uncharacterized protein n=1 Tax=Elasticomyces elasticus TaxID=574655 RepID=A0AAN7VXS4_9PEZI|nr:hypothetical protein LTR97_012268 [Elasticomyces elasticus]
MDHLKVPGSTKGGAWLKTKTSFKRFSSKLRIPSSRSSASSTPARGNSPNPSTTEVASQQPLSGAQHDADDESQRGRARAQTASTRDGTVDASPVSKELAEHRFRLWQEAEVRAAQELGTKTWSRWRDRQKHVWQDSQTSGDAITHELKAARELYKRKQWSYTREDGGDIVFADVVGRLLEAVDKNKLVWRATAALDPTHAAGIVWAGAEALITAAKDNKDILDIVLDDANFTGYAIGTCSVWGKNSLTPAKASSSEAAKLLRQELVALYTKILIYQVNACAFLEEAKFESGAKALGVSKDKRSIPKLDNAIRKDFLERIQTAGLALIGQTAVDTQKILRELAVKPPETLRDLPLLNLIRDETSLDALGLPNFVISCATLHLPQIDTSSATSDQPIGSKYGHRVPAIDLWRLLAANGSKNFPHPRSGEDTLYWLYIMSGSSPSRGHEDVSFRIRTTTALGSAAILRLRSEAAGNPVLELLDAVGIHGEKYNWPERPFLPMPVSLCFVGLEWSMKIYRSRDIQRLMELFKLLIMTAQNLWIDDGDVLSQINQFHRDAERFDTQIRESRALVAAGASAIHLLGKRVRAKHDPEQVNPEADNATDSVGADDIHQPTSNRDGQPDPYNMQDITGSLVANLDDCPEESHLVGTLTIKQPAQKMENELMFRFAHHTKWLVLALTLNLYANLDGADVLPKVAEELLAQEECCLLP